MSTVSDVSKQAIKTELLANPNCNRSALARRYGVSRNVIYAILDKVKENEIEEYRKSLQKVTTEKIVDRLINERDKIQDRHLQTIRKIHSLTNYAISKYNKIANEKGEINIGELKRLSEIIRNIKEVEFDIVGIANEKTESPTPEIVEVEYD